MTVLWSLLVFFAGAVFATIIIAILTYTRMGDRGVFGVPGCKPGEDGNGDPL